MKKLIWLLFLVSVLCGCNSERSDMDRAMQIRTKMNQAAGCSFETIITADYGDKTYQFILGCVSDQAGDISFEVLSPGNIAGITGKIDREGGKLIFDDVVLAIPLLVDEMISPVGAPWILLQALNGGYIRSHCVEEELLRITVDDSYQEDALMLDVWFDETDAPVRADIYEASRRILTLEIKKFQLL